MWDLPNAVYTSQTGDLSVKTAVEVAGISSKLDEPLFILFRTLTLDYRCGASFDQISTSLMDCNKGLGSKFHAFPGGYLQIVDG